MNRLGYIRPRRQNTERAQRDAIGVTDQLIVDIECAVLPDAIKLLRRGDRLVVATLHDLSASYRERADICRMVQARGAGIYIAADNHDVPPDCIDTLVVGILTARNDTDPDERAASGAKGGAAGGYGSTDKEQWRDLWLSDATAAEIERESGMAYSTLYRHFNHKDRKGGAIPRNARPGRRT